MIVSGAVAFGPSVVFWIGWVIFSLLDVGSGTIVDAILYMSFGFAVSRSIQLYALWDHLEAIFLSILTLFFTISSVFGTVLITEFENIWFERGLGVIMFIIFLMNAWGDLVQV